MDRWYNKLAVITGVDSKIVGAICKELTSKGLIVVTLGSSEKPILDIRANLPTTLRYRLYPRKCDLNNEDEIIKSFDWIEKTYGGTDILVNCNEDLNNEDRSAITSETFNRLLSENILRISSCTREAFKSMSNRQVDGHVIILNNGFGYRIPNFNMVNIMTEAYRKEFYNAGTHIKVTSVSPGCVDTEMVPDECKNIPDFPILKPEDVSSAVLYAISTPPHVQVHEIIIKPIGEQC